MDDLLQYYRILEIEPGASLEEIKRAYREMARVWHPDRFSSDVRLQNKAQEKLKRINLAYERICGRGAHEPQRPVRSNAVPPQATQQHPSPPPTSVPRTPKPSWFWGRAGRPSRVLVIPLALGAILIIILGNQSNKPTAQSPVVAHPPKGKPWEEFAPKAVTSPQNRRTAKEKPFDPDAYLASTGKEIPTEPNQSWNLPTLASQARPAVVYIVGSDSDGTPTKTGTGFFVSEDGKLVTNWHVVDGCFSAVAKTEDGAIYNIAGILNFSAESDIAILKADARNVRFLTLVSENTIRVGDKVAAIGSPLGYEGTLSEGIISSVRGDKPIEWLQMTAAVSHGSSGSPILNSKGQVIGVATWVVSKDGAQSLNFARPATYVSALLSSITSDATPRTFTDVAIATESEIFGDTDYVAGKSSLEQNDLGGALKSFQAAKKKFPSNPNLIFEIAFTYGELNLHEDAIRTYQKLLKIQPKDAIAWTNLAVEWAKLNRYRECIVDCQEALKVDPNYYPGWDVLGRTYLILKDFPRAVESFEQETKLQPSDPEAWRSLSVAYEGVGDTENSEQALAVSQGESRPPDKNTKPVGSNADGSTQYSNGVRSYPDGHIEWEMGKARFAQSVGSSSIVEVTPTKSLGSDSRSGDNPPFGLQETNTNQLKPPANTPNDISLRGSRLLHTPAPRYPPELISSHNGIDGSGKFRIWFDKRGHATKVGVVQSTGNQLLDKSALSALNTWTASPGNSWTVIVPVTFQKP